MENGTKDRLFRASPAYRLTLFDHLEEPVRVALGELTEDPRFYGVLEPRDEGSGTLRAVDRDAALLLLTLKEPAPLPSYVDRMSSDGHASVVRLVMDGVLEVWDGERFVGGARGAEVLLGPLGDRADDGCLGRRSREAIRYAIHLHLPDPSELANRLYGYGRLPLAPAWARILPGPEATHAWLLGGDAYRGAFAPHLTHGSHWIAWTRRRPRRESGRRTESRHKLYVSPTPRALAEIFREVLRCLETLPVNHLKVGADAAGVLRPDKLVVYFDDPAHLLETGEALVESLDGTEPHGVPFTADLGGGGLVSWGEDPPPDSRPLSWLPSESWRMWICRRLGVALQAGAGAGEPDPASLERFALARLEGDGVDVERWMPLGSAWRTEVS